MITKLADVEYRRDAHCPRFEEFMLEIMGGDVQMAAFLQQWIGYCLTGDTREQVLLLLYGLGSNGKSVLLELLRELLGDYQGRANFAAFVEQRGDRPRNDLARLAGLRLVSALEIGESARLSESVVKTVTGGDTMAARRLYEEEFEFRPQFKLMLAANHRPVIRATDFAMWRRVLLVPFAVTFDGDRRDDRLREKLVGELPGILRWAVNGCQSWLEFGLRPPARVLAATSEYRSESDTLGAFLADCCRMENSESAGALYRAYAAWAGANGEQPMTSTMFGRRLTERGIVADRQTSGKIRVGVQLLNPPDDRDRLPVGPVHGNTPLTRARNARDCINRSTGHNRSDCAPELPMNGQHPADVANYGAAAARGVRP